MNHLLSDNDRADLDKAIARVEELTSAQVVLAAVKKSDSYAEIPWKAFAVGVSVAGLALFLYDLFLPQWITGIMILRHIALILAAGVLPALMTLFFPPFARLFLPGTRKETETMQYAESLFLSHEIFATTGRKGVLLMVSRFEKQVVILPDKGLRDNLNEGVLKRIISRMSENMRDKNIKKAFEDGLEELIKALADEDSMKPGRNELPDEIIEEEGE